MAYRIVFFVFLFLIFFSSSLFAVQQHTAKESRTNSINLYLDCRGCNERFIRTQISYVNFVRDQSDADIHLLITIGNTGGGGREFTLRFIGKKIFENKNDTLKYISYQSDTEDILRRGLVKKIKVGLLPYLYQTEVINELIISYDGPPKKTNEHDKWDNWIFEIGVNSYLNGEETQKTADIRGWASARRVTEKWKIEFNIFKRFNRRSFTDEDTTEIYTTKRNRFNSLIARSISERWSVGFFPEISNSTKNNYELRISGAPSIEFNIYPYSEYTEREISFRYNLVTVYNKYDQVTIYDKTDELLIQNQLSANLNFTKQWGEIEGNIDTYSYIQDWSKNRFIFNFRVDLQITRGFSLNLSGRYSVINDQLAIPQEEISDEEQLLNLRERSTSYNYGVSIGFSYTFGSIYSTVVNSRF